MLKKKLVLYTCAIAAVVMVGCGTKNEIAESTEAEMEVTEEVLIEEDVHEDTTVEEKFESATEVLSLVHNTFDDETISFFGTITADGEVVMGTPVELSLDDAETVENMVTFPSESINLVDDAASLSHMMNGVTYTSAAFHVKNSNDIVLVAGMIMDAVTNNQWMYGSPDRLVVGQVENYVVYAYGADHLIQTFEQGLINSDGNATIHFIQDLAIEDEIPLAPTTEIIYVDENGNVIED